MSVSFLFTKQLVQLSYALNHQLIHLTNRFVLQVACPIYYDLLEVFAFFNQQS